MAVIPPITAAHVRQWQDGLKANGSIVQFIRAGQPPRDLRARVEYLGVVELANAIEQYPIRVHFDARDFTDSPPTKGDTVQIDNARRGIMSVQPVTAGAFLFAYRCGVAG